MELFGETSFCVNFDCTAGPSAIQRGAASISDELRPQLLLAPSARQQNGSELIVPLVQFQVAGESRNYRNLAPDCFHTETSRKSCFSAQHGPLEANVL